MARRSRGRSGGQLAQKWKPPSVRTQFVISIFLDLVLWQNFSQVYLFGQPKHFFISPSNVQQLGEEDRHRHHHLAPPMYNGGDGESRVRSGRPRSRQWTFMSVTIRRFVPIPRLFNVGFRVHPQKSSINVSQISPQVHLAVSREKVGLTQNEL